MFPFTKNAGKVSRYSWKNSTNVLLSPHTMREESTQPTWDTHSSQQNCWRHLWVLFAVNWGKQSLLFNHLPKAMVTSGKPMPGKWKDSYLLFLSTSNLKKTMGNSLRKGEWTEISAQKTEKPHSSPRLLWQSHRPS